jgi:hypothetical protein
MLYRPPRAHLVITGGASLSLSLYLIYKYHQLHNLVYADCAIPVLILTLYFWMHYFRNPIVSVVDDGILLCTFGNVAKLTVENLYAIKYNKDGIASYKFKKYGKYYQVTPLPYINGENMLSDFQKVFSTFKTDNHL